MEKDPVLEKYGNEGFGKNAFGWYFNPWLDEYDEDYDPHKDPEYNKDLVNKNEKNKEEIKWHPKLTKEQIEELIAENIYPGDNEYDMYLWNHGINPTEKYEEEKEEKAEETPGVIGIYLGDEEEKKSPVGPIVIHFEDEEEKKSPVGPIGIRLEDEEKKPPVGPIVIHLEDEEEKKEPIRVKPRKKPPVIEDIDSGREKVRVRVKPEDLEDEYEVVYAPLEVEEKGVFGRTLDRIKTYFKNLKEKVDNRRAIKKPSLIRRLINKITNREKNEEEQKESGNTISTGRARFIVNTKVEEYELSEEDKTPVLDKDGFRVAYAKRMKRIEDLNKGEGR